MTIGPTRMVGPIGGRKNVFLELYEKIILMLNYAFFVWIEGISIKQLIFLGNYGAYSTNKMERYFVNTLPMDHI